MKYRLVSMGEGARIEKRDEGSYNGYREIAKVVPTDNESSPRETVNELREVLEDL